MALHKLALDDFEDNEYLLFAIRSEMEAYRLAHSVNDLLNTRLQRTKSDLELNTNEKLYFPLFEWNDPALLITWNLIQNTCVVEQSISGQGLFSDSPENSTRRHYLINEHPTVDYFLKISGSHNQIPNIETKLNAAPSIHMIYPIDIDSLKTKDYLILN